MTLIEGTGGMPCKAHDIDNIGPNAHGHQLWMVDEVARYLRCSSDAVYRMVERQEIPHTRIFKRKGLRFRPEEIEEWLGSQKGTNAKEG